MGKKIFCIVIILWVALAKTAFSHPGGTDASGGHTCKTNCGQWGLNYGEYHYHSSTVESSGSGYKDGYDDGYDLAYSYSSKCEEYDWWWEGSQDYGDGFERGIEDGHKDGMLLCTGSSYNAGLDKGYSESLEEREYNDDTNGTYEYTSFIEGYAVGWDLADDEKSAKATFEKYSFTDTSNHKEEKNKSNENNKLFGEGYREGFETAEGDYIYDDYNVFLKGNELANYKKGYFSGYIEAGGGTFSQNAYYFLFHKYLGISVVLGIIILNYLIWFIVRRIQNTE